MERGQRNRGTDGGGTDGQRGQAENQAGKVKLGGQTEGGCGWQDREESQGTGWGVGWRERHV